MNFHRIYDIDLLSIYVEHAFNEDEELLSKYHIMSGSLEKCVADTMKRIADVKEKVADAMEFYYVEHAGKAIGYVIMIFHNNHATELYSFGINKHFRTKEIVTTWLWEIEKKFGTLYYLILWNKNTRAIDFFLKNNFIKIEHESVDNNKTLLVCPPEDLS